MDKVLELVKKFAVPLFLLLLFAGVVIGIVNFQKSRQEPEVTITEPKDAISTEATELVLKGKTDNAGNTVYVNGNPVEISTDKTFQSNISLTEGENIVEVEVFSKGGKSTKSSVVVTRTAAAGKPPAATIPGAPEGGAGGKEGQDKGVLGGETGGTPTPGGAPAAPGDTDGSLSTSGPKENAVLAVWILGIVLFYYLKSKKTFLESVKRS